MLTARTSRPSQAERDLLAERRSLRALRDGKGIGIVLIDPYRKLTNANQLVTLPGRDRAQCSVKEVGDSGAARDAA